MGLILPFMLAGTTMGRLILSWPGALVAAYYAIQGGWRPVLAAALGLLCGNLAVLPIIPASTDTLFALYSAPWPFLVRSIAASYLVGIGLWLVYRARQKRGFEDTAGAVFLAFLTALIAQLGNFEAQLLVVSIASGFMGTGADSPPGLARAAHALLFVFTIAETAALLVFPLLTRLLAVPIRHSHVGRYLGLAIAAAGLLIAVPRLL